MRFRMHKTSCQRPTVISSTDYVVNRPNRRPKNQSFHVVCNDAQFRALACEFLRRHGDEYLPNILKLADDPKLDGEVLPKCCSLPQIDFSEATRRCSKRMTGTTGTIVICSKTLAIAIARRETEVFQKIVDRPEVPITPAR